MNAVIKAIRLLVAVAVINCVSCQDGFSDQDLLRIKQLSNPNNDGQMDTISSFNSNNQRDLIRNEPSIDPVQYHLSEDIEKTHQMNQDFNHNLQSRSERKKVFHIKNPFLHSLETSERPESLINDIIGSHQDSNSDASNQYASMQFSLPPEEFLQKLRSENQYVQQVSTPNPLLSYTLAPQSSFQYSTGNPNNYESVQQQHQQFQQQQQQIQQQQQQQIQQQQQQQQLQQQQQQQHQIQQQQQQQQQIQHNNQIEQKISHSQYQQSHPGYQYSSGFAFDSEQSTPAPTYLSTANNNFAGTPTTSFVSSPSSVFLSSPPSGQQYVSSPIAIIQTGSPDYSNTVSTISNTNNAGFVSNPQNKRMLIDYYDNSANGMRYPVNSQQYSNEFQSSTPSPSSTPYPDPVHDSWQNSISSGVNALPKSFQDYSSQYHNSPFNQQDGRSDSNHENFNSETNRVGSVPSENQFSIFGDYTHQEYPSLHTKQKNRDLEQQASQPNVYTNGDYGWKINEKKSLVPFDGYTSASAPTRYQTYGYSADGNAVSQMNFFLDSSKNYGPISKSAAENQDAHEFAKAAAKAHENMKQQQQLARLTESYFANNYAPSYSSSLVRNAPSNVISTYYGPSDGSKSKLYADSSNTNSLLYNPQPELITASYKSKDLPSDKHKQSFDHSKALKNIVPIDVSNVIGNEPPKSSTNLDNNSNKYNIQSYNKEQLEQNFRQFYKPVTESYYKDKNSGYGFNIKIKPDELTAPDSMKQLDSSLQYYGKPSFQDNASQGVVTENKRYGETGPQQINFMAQMPNHFASGLPSPQPPIQTHAPRPQQQQQNDVNGVLKFNDIPYRLTQGLPSEALRLNNNNFDQNGIPSPIPSRINQNVGSHQIDVANQLFTKLLLSKYPFINSNRPDLDLQSAGLLSNINGFRVANPFNMDLKLVADVLKGKPTVDDSHMMNLRESYGKLNPLKLDVATLHELLKNENFNNLGPLQSDLTSIGNPYYDVYGGRYPYQGVKYSRSQEEEENIPIADASNTHPIGAVIEQEEGVAEREVRDGSELISVNDAPSGFEENRPKMTYDRDHKERERQRHPNGLKFSRHSNFRKYPKLEIGVPYPLLKPPPPHYSRNRYSPHYNREEKHSTRRRRLNRQKIAKILKTEPLFEAESTSVEETESAVPTLLKPPLSIFDAKSDDLPKTPSS